MPCDGKPIKDSSAVLTYAEKVLHHTNCQCLSKSPGPGKEAYFVICIMNKLINNLRLVNIISILLPESRKIRFPDANCKSHMRAPFVHRGRFSVFVRVHLTQRTVPCVPLVLQPGSFESFKKYPVPCFPR